MKKEMPIPEMPPGLSPSSEAIWRSVVPKRAKSLERVALLEQALRAKDRANEIAIELSKQDLTFTTPGTGTIRANPLLKAEQQSRALFEKIWIDLKLQWTSEIDGRIDS